MNPDVHRDQSEIAHFYGESVLLKNNTIYFLSGLNNSYQDAVRRGQKYEITTGKEVINGKLYSSAYALDIKDTDVVKVVNRSGKEHDYRNKCVYVVTQRGFVQIHHSGVRPISANGGTAPVQFTPFSEGVNADNFEQKLTESGIGKFRNICEELGAPEDQPSATERPKKWSQNFQENMLRLGLNIDETLIGRTVVIKTASGSVYDLKITDAGLQGVTARIAGIVFNGFSDNWSLVETRTGKRTSPVDKVLRVR